MSTFFCSYSAWLLKRCPFCTRYKACRLKLPLFTPLYEAWLVKLLFTAYTGRGWWNIFNLPSIGVAVAETCFPCLPRSMAYLLKFHISSSDHVLRKILNYILFPTCRHSVFFQPMWGLICDTLQYVRPDMRIHGVWGTNTLSLWVMQSLTRFWHFDCY